MLQTHLLSHLKMSRILLQLAAPLTVITAVSGLIYTLYHFQDWKFLQISPAPFQIVGTALAIYLSFVNNAAYARYMEARTLWGGVINGSRTFARQLLTLTFADNDNELREFHKELVYRHLAWCIALKCWLREQDPFVEISQYLSASELSALKDEKSITVALLQKQEERLHDARLRGWLTDFTLVAMDGTLIYLTNQQGGCERIKNTPIPPTYTYLTHRFVYGFCALLPLGVIDQLDAMMFFIVIPVSVVFLVLDRIGRLIERPFGMEPQDLALSSYTRTIEINLRQRLGETNLPEAIVAVEGVLA